ncbi:MAG: pilus assembly protein N-terminal domain-containing protein [Candidatus Eisenbacteria bacterium]|nr:pilus assembly protein N-terminal domain-containing protein [Candidatus Eisenbacteria bacterium]
MKSILRLFLMITISVVDFGCLVGPDDAAATSCGGVNLTFSTHVDPTLFSMSFFNNVLVVGQQSGPITICFYRDKERQADAQRIEWEVSDPQVATVEPSRGQEVRLTGRTLGRATLRAFMGSLSATREIRVCQTLAC